MKLTELQDEWAVDSKIDKTQVDEELIKIPQLHHKYITILSKERLMLKKLTTDKSKLEDTLEDYYEGRIDGAEIGRPPYQYVAGTKSKTEKRIASDQEMIDMNLKIAATEEKILYLKEVVANINQRSFMFNTYVKYLQWMQGASI